MLTSCVGHVDGMKNKQTITHQLLVRIKQNSLDTKCMVLCNCRCKTSVRLSKLHTRSQAIFNKLTICATFISANAIHRFLWHEFILVNDSYDQRTYVKSRFESAKAVEIKGLHS